MSAVLTTHTTPRPNDRTGRPLPGSVWFAAVALVVGAMGNLGQAVVWQLHGGRASSIEDQMVFGADHPTVIVVTCLLGTLAVPFMAHGFLTWSRLLARRALRTGLVAGTALVLGMWGFQAIQVAETVQAAAMLDGADAAVIWMDTLPEQPLLMVFGAPFMALAPLGLLVLSIGGLVTGAYPRWIAGTLLAFAIFDFALGSLPVDPHWLYLVAATGLAVHIVRNAPTAGHDD